MDVKDEQDHYEVLAVQPDASDDAIRDAYRWLARRFHPDQNAPGDARADAMMKRVNAAYAVLADPDARAAYDHRRVASSAASAARPSTPASRSQPPPPSPARSTPKSEQARLLLAISGAGLSAYTYQNDYHVTLAERANPGSAAVGSLLGMMMFASFVYWVSGKLRVTTCAVLLAVFGTMSIVAQNSHNEALRSSQEEQAAREPASAAIRTVAPSSAGSALQIGSSLPDGRRVDGRRTAKAAPPNVGGARSTRGGSGSPPGYYDPTPGPYYDPTPGPYYDPVAPVAAPPPQEAPAVEAPPDETPPVDAEPIPFRFGDQIWTLPAANAQWGLENGGVQLTPEEWKEHRSRRAP